MALVFLVGCNKPKEVAPQVTFVTKLSPIEFTFPKGWRLNSKEHPYDLQCFSRFEDMTTGVFVFAKEDLAEGVTPHDILAHQIQDIRSKRGNFIVAEEKETHVDAYRSINTETFRGDKGLSKHIYQFSLVQFTEDPRVFAVVLQTAVPSIYPDNKNLLREICRSARLNPNSEVEIRIPAELPLKH